MTRQSTNLLHLVFCHSLRKMSARCSNCGVEKAKTEFSKNQWRLRGKCKNCQPAATTAGVPTTGLLETNISPAFDLDRPRNIHELEKSEMIRLVEVLSRENIQLKVALNKLSTENKLIEENNRLTLQAKSVKALRMEVTKLEEEIKCLRKEMSKIAGEMAPLTTTIAHLLQSHEKQSKLAIRKLLDDAENLPDKSVLSTNAKNYIATHSNKLRRDAAYFFSLDRIKDAIKEFSGSEKMKEILIDLFVHVYGVSFEEDDPIDDEWYTGLDH